MDYDIQFPLVNPESEYELDLPPSDYQTALLQPGRVPVIQTLKKPNKEIIPNLVDNIE